MNRKQFILGCISVLMLGHCVKGNAEDIDIYSGLGTNTNVPNVLLIMDNAANFSSSASGTTCVIDGAATALSGSVGGIEQCALYYVVQNLPTNADGSARINIGMMVYNSNNIRDVNNLNCGASSSTGGCLAQPLIPMDAAHKTSFLAWIKSWVITGGAGSGYIKASGEATAAAMQEAWAYYHGSTGLSGRSYASIQPAGGCQKNFVIFIGNSYSSSGTPGDSAGPATELNNAPNVTAAQKALILNTLTTSCGSYTFPSSAHENKGFYADEWARYMNQSDLYGSPTGVQNITTYSVGILGASCQAEYAATLTNMALYGGGKYFATTDYNGLVVAILKILNEVQSVNSVFSSASLPVSVNAQGTYLNQIFMGMFRPDAGALPRWAGNLKQYEFIVDAATGALQLGDSAGNAALDASGTGFLSPNAISFWTSKDTATAPDSSGGFWKNFPSSANAVAGGYDSPDGELVERGGASQQLRLANLTDNYTTSPSTPRKLYTYCPSGTGCNINLTNAANAFATTNASITAALFGSASTANISSLTRSGSTVTVATSGNHGFLSGDSVTIANASPDDYNGTHPVSVVDPTHFTYSVTEEPPAVALGSYTASISSAPQSVTLTRSGNTVTATAVGHGFTNGATVTISGASQSQYNGSFVIGGVTANTFTYTVTETPALAAGGGSATSTKNATGSCPAPCMSTVTINAWNAATPGVVRTLGSTTVTVTAGSNHGYSSGNTVTLTGVTDSAGNSVAAYNGSHVIASVPSVKSFTFTVTPSPATPATGSITASIPSSPVSLTSLTRSGSTATATAAAHGFTNGQSISIGGTPGANEEAYIGTYTISNVTAATFDYSVATTPATPANGLGGATMTASRGGVAPDRTSMINWIRGEDNYGDETGPGGSVTIRPSVHGDVVHSRPTVINYGGTTGVVVYYGENGGVYHAVNGNQVNPSGSTMPTPGGELWGFIPSEFFLKFSRLRTNSPQLNLPSTPPGILPAPKKKDYFIDGATGVYQLTDGTGTTLAAYLYLTMRRGGNFIYALDVTDPTTPKLLWKIDNTSTGMGELGQTWSQPKVAMVAGHTNPVLIFGAGYDTEEDVEPPSADTAGRGIFVLDAFTGAVVWKATPQASGFSTSCSGNATQAACLVAGMNYSIPSDITLMDRDSDSRIDRLYAADTGGNIWRVDLEPNNNATPDNWRVYKLAALGCGSGTCASGTTPRKFFYPPEVINTSTFDAVIAGSGDREHPLFTDSSFAKRNRLYLLKDMYTSNNASGMSALTQNDLFDATSATWDGSLGGYLITLDSGEKVINAPLVTAGYVFFGTNQPTAPTANSCTSSLGTARGYRLKPFTGAYDYTVFSGGGLPPSPVSGIVTITVNGVASQVPFLIGAGNPDCVGADCTSALGGQKPPIEVPTSRIRTYWYQEGK